MECLFTLKQIISEELFFQLQANKENSNSFTVWSQKQTPFGIAQFNANGEIKLDQPTWSNILSLQGRKAEIIFTCIGKMCKENEI